MNNPTAIHQCTEWIEALSARMEHTARCVRLGDSVWLAKEVSAELERWAIQIRYGIKREKELAMNTNDSRPASLAAAHGSACLWLTSKPSGTDEVSPKPTTDDDGSKVTANNPISSDIAAEIAVETSDLEISDGEELAVWVWQPGDVANAIEYFVRVSWSWSFSSKKAGLESP
jgi:hypothetical protein